MLVIAAAVFVVLLFLTTWGAKSKGPAHAKHRQPLPRMGIGGKREGRARGEFDKTANRKQP